MLSAKPSSIPYRIIGVILISLMACVPIFAVLSALLTNDFESWARLWQTTLPKYIMNTICLMVLVGSMTAFVGTLTAWCVTAFDFPFRRTMSWLLILPLSAPAYIIAYLYTDMFEFYGPVQTALRGIMGWQGGDYWFPAVRTLFGASLMLSLVLYPYVYLLARAAFLYQSSGQWHAARSLGLSPTRAFIRVALPAARPAIAGGLALVLMETLADFGVADYFAIPTFSTGIFRNWLALGDKSAALKLAAMMLLMVFLLVMLESFSRRGSAVTHGKTTGQSGRIQLSRKRSFTVLLTCFMPVLFGFVIPVITLCIYAFSNGDSHSSADFIGYMFNSLSTASIVAVIAVTLAVFLAYARRTNSNPALRVTLRLATLGYALPGALLAVGLLAPLGVFDQGLSRFARDTFGWNSGLILTGTTIALVYALTIRFLTVSFNSVTGGFDKIPPAMDSAARSLGAKPMRLVRRIHVPLLRSSVIGAAILVFIDVMRELPATLILRPFNFETLATRVYWLANDERLSEASTAALLIILIGIIPILFLNKQSLGDLD
ncbi:iron(III) transport system permease protein [Litorimonas taeanensis]|uniref:Iron(III) transport system permease protein n=1 Tax=Litorimonas taeanensis TaxID=568099 RepID=A0A420WK17_9PROT|nr:iron ABC transporter permease [Litorimonas taeanensis]RKQ71381.1 iron(III) transport system permease protein [Litorimonas taeanensis]